MNWRGQKTLGFFAIFGFCEASAAVAVLKRRGGGGAATFRWCGYDWRDSLYLGLVSAEAKAVYSVYLWYVVSAGPSKTSERAQPDPKRFFKFCQKMVRPVWNPVGTSMYCVKGVSEKTLAWKLILAKAPIARTYSAARWGSGEHCSPDGGWGNAPVLL